MSGRPRKFQNQSILNVALNTFWVNGYNACTTAKLCETTGLGKGSLYNAYGNKHKLYKQALQYYCEQSFRKQQELLRGTKPAKEKVRILMESAINDDLNDMNRKGCFALNTAIEIGNNDSEIADIVKAHFDCLEKELLHIIEQGQQSGEIVSQRPSLELARLVRSSFYGLRVLCKVEPNKSTLMDIVKGTLATL